jgi:uncharacterized protein (DUF2461 family)
MCSAVVAPGGKKNKAINGIYFELGPEHVRAYGGVYEIEKEDLEVLREGIAENLEVFQKLYSAKNFKATFGHLRGDANKKLPPHLKEAAEKEPLIYNKQFYFFAEFPATIIMDENLDQLLLECYAVGQPLESFFNQFIQRS